MCRPISSASGYCGTVVQPWKHLPPCKPGNWSPAGWANETESGGFAYEKTDKGGQAYTEIKQIERNWLAMWESRIEPERPEYVNWFEKKNSELKALRAEKERTTEELRADKEQLVGTIATQQRLIASQDFEIERLKVEIERLKKAAGEGANPDRVPFPL